MPGHYGSYREFAQAKLRSGMSMKEVGSAWREHKKSGGSMTSMVGGGAVHEMKGAGHVSGHMTSMKGGSAKKAKKRPAAKPMKRDYAVLAGRGLGGYAPGTMTGGGLKPANEIVEGAGLGDDILDGVGKFGKAVAPYAPLLGLFL